MLENFSCVLLVVKHPTCGSLPLVFPWQGMYFVQVQSLGIANSGGLWVPAAWPLLLLPVLLADLCPHSSLVADFACNYFKAYITQAKDHRGAFKKNTEIPSVFPVCF